jgi:predicted alpha/beta superfamily hydrolase
MTGMKAARGGRAKGKPVLSNAVYGEAAPESPELPIEAMTAGAEAAAAALLPGEAKEPVPLPHSSRLRLHAKFHSRFLAADRDLVVYVPEGYEEHPERRYPVLYLHDGQNLFTPETAYVPGRIWNVHETADRLIGEGKIEPLIIAGVANTGADRIHEYTPARDPKMGGGLAHLYGRMLVEELKPFLDREYRTLHGPEHTGIGGSSLGGLVTIYLGLRYPLIFGRLAVLSPSVWWRQRWILKYVNRVHPEPRPRIWLDMGTAEGQKALHDADLLHEALRHRGWRDGEDLLYARVPGGTHDEAAWAQRVEPFLKFLFPAERE